MIDYSLKDDVKKKSLLQSTKEVWPFLRPSLKMMFFALICVAINSAITIIGPFLVGDITDVYIPQADKHGLVQAALLVLVFYIVAFIANFLQILVMGRVGQDVLFRVRQTIFEKLQELPLAFFNQNKSGDIISRINNDTDKLNQAFSETILRFIGNIFIIIGIGIIVLITNFTLGAIIVGISLLLLTLTVFVNPWIKHVNKINLEKLGDLSGEVQEDVGNYKVFIAFGRRDYFRNKFNEFNQQNKIAARMAGVSNTILTSVYEYGSNIGTLVILVVGIGMLQDGSVTFGDLLAFLLYSERLFQPLRIMAALFASIQTSLAAWARISFLLEKKTDMQIIHADDNIQDTDIVISFENVSFSYDEQTHVLHDLSFDLHAGKTYAFVGPTGGGKSTTASLLARLYDPTKGTVKLFGRDIRSFEKEQVSDSIGFILQDPFLFSGTIAENIVYGNKKYKTLSKKMLQEEIERKGLSEILSRFPQGLDTKVTSDGGSISLGQRQLLAFMRAILRVPKVLILDEATANVDTVTEGLLEKIVNTLPEDTTKIVIAHRLHTIENADEIFFIAGGRMQKAMNFKDAVALIEDTSRGS